MSEFDKWWATQPEYFPARTELEKAAARTAWQARRNLDAAICRNTSEPLDPSAAPGVFAEAIEAIS